MTMLLSIILGFNIAGADPVLLKNGREIFASYASITGLSEKDTELKELYRLNADRFPKLGQPEELSNSVILASTELGGAFCSRTVLREKDQSRGQRILFSDVDFKQGPSQFRGFSGEKLLSQLALAYWQRNLQEPERQSLLMTVDKTIRAGTDTPQDTLKFLQVICTVYATSLSFLSK